MLFFIIAGLCLFYAFGSLAIVPGLVFSFPAIITFLIDITMSLLCFYGNIFVFIVTVTVDFLGALLHVASHIVPFVWHLLKPLVVSIFRFVTVQCGNFLRHQTEVFLVGWGIFIGTMYLYINRFRHFFNSEIMNERNRHRRRRRYNENYNQNETANAEDNTNAANNNRRNGNDFDANNRNREQDGGTNDNTGNRYESENNSQNEERLRRLYPVVPSAPALPDEEFRRDDNDIDGRTCVVCFERERGIAVFPCGHTHLCMICTRQIMRRTQLCPLCQQRILEFRQVFV